MLRPAADELPQLTAARRALDFLHDLGEIAAATPP